MSGGSALRLACPACGDAQSHPVLRTDPDDYRIYGGWSPDASRRLKECGANLNSRVYRKRVRQCVVCRHEFQTVEIAEVYFEVFRQAFLELTQTVPVPFEQLHAGLLAAAALPDSTVQKDAMDAIATLLANNVTQRLVQVPIPIHTQWVRIIELLETQAERKSESSILDEPIDQALSLTIRSLNILKAEGVQSVRDLVRLSEEELQANPLLGRASIRDVQGALAAHGLELGMWSVEKKR